MNKPNVLLFDIDNTLLDFSAGAMQAMEEIFRAAGLPYAPEMFAVFQVENDKLWARIERGELTIAGLRDVRWQVNRLRRAGMLDAFERLFISGQMGAEKPSRVFFDRCLAQLPGVRPEQCLMIGDSLTADIAGGRAVGMRTCWFDPADRGAAMPPQADWRITRLEELFDIL